MKRSLSWLELLWYLPLYIISVYFHLNSVMVLVLVAVGYTVSHYHKYASSEEYRENYKKSFLFVHTKDTPATLQISCIWAVSYTHLDVYKRQSRQTPDSWFQQFRRTAVLGIRLWWVYGEDP